MSESEPVKSLVDEVMELFEKIRVNAPPGITPTNLSDMKWMVGQTKDYSDMAVGIVTGERPDLPGFVEYCPNG